MAEIGEKKPLEGDEEASEVIPEIVESDDEVVEESEKPVTRRRRGPRLPHAPVEDEETSQVAKLRQWPPIPGPVPTFEQAEDYMHKLTVEQWDHATIYVWRMYPAILRDPKYIDVISEAQEFNRLTIINRHGGGKYKLAIKDNELLGGKGKIVMTTYLTIPLTEADPVLDYSELDLGYSQNKSYVDNLVNRGIIDRSGKVMDKKSEDTGLSELAKELVGHIVSLSRQQVDQVRQQARSNEPSDVAITKAMDIIAQAGTKSNELLVERVKAEDPSKMLTLIESLAKHFGPGSKPDSNMEFVRQMMELQGKSFDAQVKMMEKMMELQRPREDDSTEDKLLDKLIKMKDFFGSFEGGRGGRKSTVEAITDVLPSILNPIATSIANLVKLQGLKKGIAVSAEMPTPLPAGSEGMGGEGMEQPEPGAIDASEFVRQYGGMVLQALNNGVPGEEFADHIVGIFGLRVHGMISSIGKEKILVAMKSVPQFYSEVQFVWPQVEEFVDRFIRYAEIGDEEDETPKVEVKEEKKDVS